MSRWVVLIALLATGCTDADGARRSLQEQGYTQVQTEGYSWFGCGKGDTFATRFSAKSVAGLQVKGVVCSDWFKGTTIRTF